MELNRYLISQYFDNFNNDFDKEILDKIKIELDWRIYHYGKNFNNPFEGRKKTVSFKASLRDLKNKLVLLGKSSVPVAKNTIISSIYFSNFNERLLNLGYDVKSPIWLPRGKAIDGNLSLYNSSKQITNILKYLSFSELTSEDTIKLLRKYEEDLTQFYYSTDPFAIFLFTDQYFFSKVAIDIFKRLGKKSFVLSHGLPGIYSKHVDSKADYLLVWGDKIRNNYLKAGFDPEKVKVIGHPTYDISSMNTSLRNSLDNILVLPKAMPWHQHTYDPVLVDRGTIIVYLLSIKKTLRRLGVNNARLRPHPSANMDWILSIIGNDFFMPDQYSDLNTSLNKSTLIIGPTSTVFLESLLTGVNYVVYEPQAEGVDLFGYKVDSPFDGTDVGIPVAKNEDDLSRIITDRISCESNIISGYLHPFDIEALNGCLKSQ